MCACLSVFIYIQTHTYASAVLRSEVKCYFKSQVVVHCDTTAASTTSMYVHIMHVYTYKIHSLKHERTSVSIWMCRSARFLSSAQNVRQPRGAARL
jgi:hypothetical protein